MDEAMNRKKNTLNCSRFGLYHTTTETCPYGFNILSVNNPENDSNGGPLLLNVRFISSIEDLSREVCRVPKLSLSSDKSFGSSISQANPANVNYLSAVRSAITGDAPQLLYLVNILKVSVNATNSQGITLLHWATANDHVAVARLLLSLGADLRLTTIKGRSILHTATCNGAANCLKLFLKIFFEQEKTIILSFIMKYFGWIMMEEMLQQCNQSNQTPIHVACLWNNVEAANLLLTDNLNKIVNKIYNSTKRVNVAIALREASRRTLSWQIGRGTVLHEMATMKCSFACFTKNSPSLLEYDNKLEAADLKMYLLSGCIAIETFEKRCLECDKAQLEVVRVILKCRPELILLRDVLGQTALMCSVISDAVSVTKALLLYRGGKEQWLNKQLKSIDSDFHTALHHAAAGGKLRQAVLLLKYGATVRGQDSYGATPMHYAAIRGFCATLKLLYRANKYTDEVRTNNGHSALMWAAMSGMDTSIRTMIDANSVGNREDCDTQGCTALHLAAAGDHIEVINTLLCFKWNAEKRNKLGETPLIVAAKSGSTKAVRRFLHAGVDYSSKDKFNNTALHVAADSDGKWETLRQLLRYLKDSSLLNTQNNLGQTPLHCAIEHNAVQCVRYLLRHGADPLIRDNRGWDPLMIAIQQGCWSTIILMLKNSSNINCYSAADNQTTLSLALKNKNYILASFLETNGALLANEIQHMAAGIIQRWYRARSASRCHRHIIQTFYSLKGRTFQ
ncbi:Ankyrin repeats (3 copies) family protein [Acanthocheilonema viteae]